jgi:hypothetical protein
MPKSRHRLARQDAARGIGDRAADDDGQALAGVGHQFIQRKDGGLGIERVKDGLDQEQIGAAFQQALGLFAVGVAQLIEADVAGTRVVHIGADAGRARRGAQGTGGLARLAGGGHVQLAGDVAQAVVFLGDAGGTEGVGLDQVSAGSQVLVVDLADHIGPGELQQVVVALQILAVVGKARAAKVGFAELVALDHGAHRAVDDDDALRQQGRQGGAARVGGVGR